MNRITVGSEALTLEHVKLHLAVYHDLDDVYINSLIPVARKVIEDKTNQVIVLSNYTGVKDELIYPVISDDGDGNIVAGYDDVNDIPPDLTQAMLLIIYDLYTKRGTTVKKLPDSVDYLITYQKKYGYQV
ncbi:head-tail connector protein [Carboxylicivirga sp. M1479]|uniref:head-tail connector protein n=1 Tax=Carboxylicivirga sp. M1479 TaxID=2594476 RepID=UPI0011775E4E|nr:head-tail connector protein [Carboxylicivirga sp. M1479]TRX71510.1 phage gp6-like head-tail connector protein [Carboxylicivirga sp. M1479]